MQARPTRSRQCCTECPDGVQDACGPCQGSASLTRTRRRRLRVTRDSRGDTSVLLRISDLQTEDGDVLLGGLY